MTTLALTLEGVEVGALEGVVVGAWLGTYKWNRMQGLAQDEQG